MKLYSSPSFNNLPLRGVQTYTENEIAELFDLSEEESVELTKVISNQVAINKVYSSQKTEERLAEILTEANEFATEQLGKLNFLSIDLATSVDEVVDEHVLYLIDNGTSTNTYNQYVLINGVATLLGSTQCDLTNYVTNEQLNEKLEDYAKKNEVLSVSDIVTTIDENSTDTTIPSSATVKTFVEDSLPEIITTLDDTVTDEQIPSAKVVHDNLSAKLENNGFDRVLFKELSNGYKTQIVELEDLIVIDYYLAENFNADATRISIHHSGNIDVTKYYKEGENYRSITKKVCMTSVEDVPVTQITSFLDANITPISNNSCKYCVENGWCHLVLEININAEKLYAWDDVLDTSQNIPKPKMNLSRTKMVLASGVGDTIIVSTENGTLCMFGSAKVGQYFGSISYPVAEE